MAIPASQKAIRRIAMRQGLLFGSIIGLLVIASTVGPALLARLHPDGFYPFYSFGLFAIVPLLGCVAFFLAGLRTAKKTGRVEMGALAGFWTAIFASLFGLVALILQTVISFEGSFHHFGLYAGMYWNMSLGALYAAGAYMIVALLLGTAIGVLGGFIGKAYANDVPPIQSMPPLYMYPPTQPAQPPAMPPQNQE